MDDMKNKRTDIHGVTADDFSASAIHPTADGDLFARVASILEQARSNVVRSVNSNMVMAYWLIGREIVLELQGGEERAEYGKQVLDNLSDQLTIRYGKGYSATNLKYFRIFYQAYPDRLQPIRHPVGDELAKDKKAYPAGRELADTTKLSPTGRELTFTTKSHPLGDESRQGFSPLLSWSHYRALMRVENADARSFYEQEAIECGWSKAQLERQIQSSYYQRIISNRGKSGLAAAARDRLPGEPVLAESVLKSPYVLEFLGLPDARELHESAIEQAIIDNLQSFLLELGKGFSFVARQKHIRFDDDAFYVDLVFYNFMIKCFLLIELKIGKLTHRDVGQMDGYVRLFEDRLQVPGDIATNGLVLCSDKRQAVAKYSVVSEGRQIFASKYLQFLPSEQELILEMEKERKQIETGLEERRDP